MGRPTDRLLIWKISNRDIFATGHPIHFMFTVGFGGRRIEWRYFWSDEIQGKISNE